MSRNSPPSPSVSADVVPAARHARVELAHRRLVGAGIVIGVLVVVTLLGVAVGSADIRPETVWTALAHYDPGNPEHIAVVEKRVPRTVAGLLVGAALGIAGAVAQGVTRNPLADPGILGVNQGAALAVVVGITVFGAVGSVQYMWFAWVGGALAAVVVWAVSSGGREGATPAKLSLAGAALSAALAGLVSAVLLIRQDALDALRFWQVGALAGRGPDVLLPVLPVLVVALLAGLASGRVLNLFALGDDTAAGLGMRVGRARLVAALIVVALAGGATAVAGPIAFVGLVVPHIVRLLAGVDYRWILAFSAPVGAAFLVAADVVARVVARPGEVQVGVVVAVVGAPVFIAIVRRMRVVGL